MSEPLPETALFLHQSLDLPRLTTIADVGANPINAPTYAALLGARACRVVGFEPQPSAFAELAGRSSPYETYFPVAIGDGRPAMLHVMRSSGMTSLLPPHEPGSALLGRPGWARVRETIALDTSTLDSLADLPEIDMLKMDIQGGEAMVLDGARRALSAAVCVIIELRYLRLYEHEPMMGGIDCQLREMGFALHKFMFNKGAMLANSQSDRLRERRIADQLIDGDAVYLRDLTRIAQFSDAQLGHLALLATATFDSPSLALLCLDTLVARGKADPGLPSAFVDHMPMHLRIS